MLSSGDRDVTWLAVDCGDRLRLIVVIVVTWAATLNIVQPEVTHSLPSNINLAVDMSCHLMSVQLIIGLSVYFSLTAVVIIIVIVIIKIRKDKVYDGLKKSERDQHDYVDLQPRKAADADCGVSIISNVAQIRGSGLLHTAHVHVKGQGNIFRAGIAGPPRESNKCTLHENMSEDTQYETLAQQTRDEGHDYMSLPVRSAASRPQEVVKIKSLPPL